MRRGLVLLVLASAVVAGCSSFTREVEPYRPPVYYGPPESADPGRFLYLRDCAHCHGDEGRGTARAPAIMGGTNGPALVDFVLSTGRMPIEEPVQQMRRATPVYDDNQIAAIVAYVTEQFRLTGPDIPHVDPARGELARGLELYEEHCAACHATTGIGGAMLIRAGRQVPGKTEGISIPDFEGTDAQEIADAVRTGPGSMPVFGPRAIADDELDSLVRYLLYLKDPADPGGAPIGRVGPVVEGAVGWLFGLGTLLLVVRWLGTRAGEVE